MKILIKNATTETNVKTQIHSIYSDSFSLRDFYVFSFDDYRFQKLELKIYPNNKALNK